MYKWPVNIRNRKPKLGAILLLVLGLAELQAQNSFNASGGDKVSGGGSISYSLGQMVYETQSGTTGFLHEGVQLPYEIFIIIGIEEYVDINVSWSVFPNPSSDFLIIKTENPGYSNLKYQLFDINGKILDTGTIESDVTLINNKKNITGIFFLKVIHENREIKTFKIIKNKQP